MRRVIGMDIHRTFAEVVFWEDGKLRPTGRVSMTRAGLEGFGRSLGKEDEVVIEATGNAMAVVRVLSPYVARVIVANPLQVKAIAHAHVKTDRRHAGFRRKVSRQHDDVGAIGTADRRRVDHRHPRRPRDRDNLHPGIEHGTHRSPPCGVRRR
jgi:hypothetical protein